MSREKMDYRYNIARINQLFPNSGTLTVSEAAEWLKCDRHTVTEMIRKRKLPAVNISLGGKNAKWRIAVEALARLCS